MGPKAEFLSELIGGHYNQLFSSRTIGLLAIIGAVIALTIFIPQVQTALRSHNNYRALAALSIRTQILITSNAVVWSIYGIAMKQYWVCLLWGLTIPLAVLTTFWIVNSRRFIRKMPPITGCLNCGVEGPHKIFLTEHDYGNIVNCDAETAQQGVPVRLVPDPEFLKNMRQYG